ncbi:MAG TPA: hypothetical protein VFM18_14215 [Methanosarcina sp.]|nr:hypothetical protein [Methanosarcina sp.]
MRYFIIAVVLALSACASKPKVVEQAAPQPSIEQITTGFTGTGVQVTFTKDGTWKKITSTASASIQGDDFEAQTNAGTIATMRARRQISEFLNLRISSKKTFETISDSMKANQASSSMDAESDAASKEQSSKATQHLVDSIQQTSSAILSGTIVQSEYVDAEKKTVTVVVVSNNPNRE